MSLFKIVEWETFTEVTVNVSDADFVKVLRAVYRLGWEIPSTGKGYIQFLIPGVIDFHNIEQHLESELLRTGAV